MKCWHHWDFERCALCGSDGDVRGHATQPRDAEVACKQQLCGWATEGHDYLWADDRQLRQEVRAAALDFSSQWSSIPRRPRLQHVRDVHGAPFKTHRRDHPVQFVAGWPYKGPTRLVLAFARRFANEDEFRIRASLAKDDVSPTCCLRAVRTLGCVQCSQLRKSVCFGCCVRRNHQI
jgi:hypothetical protein